jgi:hypothetical protein
MVGLAAESARLRPPLGGVAAVRHGLWRQGGRRIHLVRPELVPVIGRAALVLPGDTAVLDSVPGHPRQHPSEAMITLITCDPPWTGTHRIIVFGSLRARNVALQP